MGYLKPDAVRLQAPPPPTRTAYVATRTPIAIAIATLAAALPAIGPMIAAAIGVPLLFGDAKRARLRRERYAAAQTAFLANPAKGTAVGNVQVTPLHKVR